MLTQTQQHLSTLEEYRKLEETADFRSEYHDGEIIAMTGGTINHNRIIRNLGRVLGNLVRGKEYEIFLSDLRLWIPAYRRGFYPDVMAIAGKPILNEDRKDEVLNPSLIVEVLSNSTRDFDRGKKFRFYRSIPTLREYLLIDQYEYSVEQYVKNESEKWIFQEYESADANVSLVSLEVEMLMSDIYEGVTFEDEVTE
ncbi:Uma2 family endonuclease [Argonema antarcticum]|uniref:Uma2 family endonuclease n=1 Tax=Argonema antarcticum TaxID=2942763 RepID=UPI0020130B70|nr:Uma2 family endonuclease [Argonema antarcticum]MCL1475716.1 Uma2 family endonuclease [Argonema antarcticum A004/B2]